LPSFAAWSKIEPDSTILSGLKIEVTKNYFKKNVLLKSYSSIKKNQKDSNDF
jgi:hypothetical protein